MQLTLLKKLWHHTSSQRRRQFAILLMLMILGSFAELVSIGAVIPFLGALTAPESIFNYAATQPLIKILGVTSPEQLLMPISIFFGLAVLVSGAVRLCLIWFSIRLSYAAGADLSLNIYRRTLYQPYYAHAARNSSEIINGITNKTNTVISSFSLVLNLIGSSILLTVAIITLVFVAPIITFVVIGGLGLIYIVIILFTRKQLSRHGQCIAQESTYVIKALQEGLGGIRDVLIDGTQNVYCQIYRSADLPLRRAQGTSQLITVSPRYILEVIGMLVIVAVAYTLTGQGHNINNAIPILGAIALGAQRLLPELQKAFSAWGALQVGQASLKDACELLEQPLPYYVDNSNSTPLVFSKDIFLNNVSFRYSIEGPLVLNNLSLRILKGSRTGIIGTTGGGKSTLLDVVMGLLDPTEGLLEIDGKPVNIKNQRAWQFHIAHVPQAIFLTDSTIEENIAFGVPRDEIDLDKVRHAAQQAQIADIIETWPKKYKTFVGERGIRLSGGQRQRIGIARALYKEADVIIFDEATSSLDNKTEQTVMQSIESLGDSLTIIIIAHRLTTLKNCNQIVELSNGKIKKIGKYQDIVAPVSDV